MGNNTLVLKLRNRNGRSQNLFNASTGTGSDYCRIKTFIARPAPIGL